MAGKSLGKKTDQIQGIKQEETDVDSVNYYYLTVACGT